VCLVEFRVVRVEVSFVMLKFCFSALRLRFVVQNVSKVDAGLSCRNF
jgi:hypothetical protein